MLHKNEMKEIYFSFLEEYGISCNDVIVSSGGAMLMLGLRETIDGIDIEIPMHMYHRMKLVENNNIEIKIAKYPDPKQDKEYFDFKNSPVSVHIMEVGIKTINVDGVVIYTPDELLKQKESLLFLNRVKDRVDIEKLRSLKINDLKNNVQFRTVKRA